MAVERLRDLCAGAPQILAWLGEHGLDADAVALSDTSGPFIDGNQMTVNLYERDRNEPVTVRTVTLLRPPPDLFHIDGTPLAATVPA